MTTSFIIPGLGNSDENHWQTHFENSGENFIRINQKSWDEPDCEDWIQNIEKAISAYEPSDVVLIAHSMGCTAVAQWAKLGLKPAVGGKFGAPQAEAFIMIPQGINGPAFLVTRNFMAIMAYNQSHSYALAVGHLGDRIAGRGGIVAQWPDVVIDLEFAERVEVQKRLTALGFNTGGSDGRLGARTYEAVIGFQKQQGLTMDGQPSRKLLEQLRRAG